MHLVLICFGRKLWLFQLPSSCFWFLDEDVEPKCQMPRGLPGVLKQMPTLRAPIKLRMPTARTGNKTKCLDKLFAVVVLIVLQLCIAYPNEGQKSCTWNFDP